MDQHDLDVALRTAHTHHDIAALIMYYSLAADRAEDAGKIEAACFYLTHAFVFALEAGAPEARTLNKRLADRGRAKILEF